MTLNNSLLSATANNASAATFDYIAAGQVTSLLPTLKIMPTKLTIDTTTYPPNLVLRYPTNILAIGSELIIQQNSLTKSTIINALTTTYINPSSSITLSITGNTDSPPIYALNSTNIPTVTNAVVANNLITASADNATAQTFDYVTSNNINSIQAKAIYTPGALFNIVSGSTASNPKLSGANSINVGDTLYFDVNGVISQNTVATVSSTQASNNWINTVSPSGRGGFYCGVTYGLGMFIAVSKTYYDPKNQYMYSSDGIAWNTATLPVSCPFNSIAFGNGKFVMVSGNRTYQFDRNISLMSTDGVNWTQGTLPFSCGWSVCYGNSLFVAVASRTGFTTNTFAISTDGITWTSVNAPANTYWSAVCYGGGKFVAVAGADDYPATGTTIAAYSTDGTNWTASVLPFNLVWYGVAYGNGRFIAAAAYSSGGQGAYSTDGINWTAITTMTTTGGGNGVITFGGGVFVVGSFDSTSQHTCYSTDGINWTFVAYPYSGCITQGLCYGNGKFVATHQEDSSGESYPFTYMTFNLGATYTLTVNPALTNNPSWAAKAPSNLTLSTSVSTSTTPNFTATTNYTISRNNNLLTMVANQIDGQIGTHAQIKIAGLNNSDTISQIGANLSLASENPYYLYSITGLSKPLTAYPTNVFLGGQRLAYSLTDNPTSNFIDITDYSYITDTNNTTVTVQAQSLISGVSGNNLVIQAKNINDAEVVSLIGADLYVQVTE